MSEIQKIEEFQNHQKSYSITYRSKAPRSKGSTPHFVELARLKCPTRLSSKILLGQFQFEPNCCRAAAPCVLNRPVITIKMSFEVFQWPQILYLNAIVSPRAKFHVAALLVKWEILHVDLARGFVNGRRLPYHFAGVL